MNWEFDQERAAELETVNERWGLDLPESVIRNMGQDKPDNVERLMLRCSELEIRAVEDRKKIVSLSLERNRYKGLYQKLKKKKEHA